MFVYRHHHMDGRVCGTSATSVTSACSTPPCGSPAARGITKNVLVRAMLIKSTKIRPSITEPLFRVGRPAVVQRVLNTYHPIRYRTPLHNLGATLSSFEKRRMHILKQTLVRTAQKVAKAAIQLHMKHVRTATVSSRQCVYREGCFKHTFRPNEVWDCLPMVN